MKRILLSFIAFPLLCAASDPEQSSGVIPNSPDGIQVISISATKDPELMSYRTLLAGVDAFEAHHELAPGVPFLRFKLSPSSATETAYAEGLSLRIQGNDTSIPVPIAADGSFSLPRSQSAYDEGADLILNKKKGSFRGREEVRTPGIPENMRRLGDLRLECEVRIAMAKSEMNFLQRTAITTALMGSDWCQSKHVSRMSPASAALDSATVVFGERRLALQIAPDKRYFMAPIADKKWPDDALIEFQFSVTSLPTGEAK